jgi:hypothetical protein
MKTPPPRDPVPPEISDVLADDPAPIPPPEPLTDALVASYAEWGSLVGRLADEVLELRRDRAILAACVEACGSKVEPASIPGILMLAMTEWPRQREAWATERAGYERRLAALVPEGAAARIFAAASEISFNSDVDGLRQILDAWYTGDDDDANLRILEVIRTMLQVATAAELAVIEPRAEAELATSRQMAADFAAEDAAAKPEPTS